MNQPEIKALIGLLDDTDEEIFFHVEEKLISLGTEVIPLLEDAWSGAFDPILQTRIANIVHRIQFETLLEDLKLWLYSGEQDLLEGCLLIARYQYPDLEKEKIVQQIAQLRKEVWIELNENLTALEQINVVNHVLFSRFGFSGNTTHYHSPKNSFLNCVLESNKGNPLSLGILYVLVASHAGLPVYGVNLPEHFVLAYIEPVPENNSGRILFYINAFSKGTVFGRSEIDQFIERLKMEPQESFYQPCSNRDMILRMLRNLSNAYQKQADTEKLDEINRMIALFTSSL